MGVNKNLDDFFFWFFNYFLGFVVLNLFINGLVFCFLKFKECLKNFGIIVCVYIDFEGKSGIGWREREEEDRGGGEREGVVMWESVWMIGGLSRDWCLGFSDWSEERLEDGDKKSSYG